MDDVMPAVTGNFPAIEQGSLYRLGRFGNLFQKVVGVFLAIDISRGDFRMFYIVVGKLDRGAVVVHGGDTGQSSGGALIQYEDLALGRPLLPVHHLLTVHLQEMRCLLNESIDLGSRHIMIFGQSHENSLAAAFLGEEEFPRGQVGVHGDGVGSLEIAHRQSEGFGHGDAGFQVMLDLQRNNFGVRRDRFGNGFTRMIPWPF